MESFLENMHKDAISKLRISTEDGVLLTDAAIDIIMMNGVVQREGLLGLEEFAGDYESSFAQWLVMLIAGGTDYDLLSEMAANEYWMRASEGVYAMVDYMYIRGLLCIQQGGLSDEIFAELLQTLIPPRLRPEFLIKLQNKQTAVIEKEKKEIAEKFAGVWPIFQDAATVEKIHALEDKICKFSNRTIQRVVRDLDGYCAAVCIYAMDNDAREKVLGNMSLRYRDMIIEDIVRFTPIDEGKVLKYIDKTLCIINKLSERGEINEADKE